MINFNSVLYSRGKYILVVYNKMEENVAKMVLRYYDTEEFNDNVFVLKVLTNEHSDNIVFRDKFPEGKKFIYYQLDHLSIHPEYMAPEYIGQFDEIWDFALENTWCYPEEMKDKVHFMPLRYVDIPKIPPKDEYRFDVAFIGTLTPFRTDWLSKITQYWTDKYVRVKLITGGVPYNDLYSEIADCKFILDIPRSPDGFVQNQVRIFEALCSGKGVITRNGPVDVFDWLIEKVDRYRDIYEVIKKEPRDVSGFYKGWTDDVYNYEAYRKAIMMDQYKPRLI